MLAALAHASVFLGLPLFLIPMLQKEDEFALAHAKAAGANFVFWVIAFGLTMITCGLAFPLLFLTWIPMIAGWINVANDERPGGLALGSMGQQLFPKIKVNDHKQLE